MFLKYETIENLVFVLSEMIKYVVLFYNYQNINSLNCLKINNSYFEDKCVTRKYVYKPT